MGIMKIPVTKAKGEVIEIDTDAIPANVYAEALAQGLKVLLNRGASKITAVAHPKPEELKAKALEVANAQLELINTGKIKITGVKAAKTSGAEMTEAMRRARLAVKDAMKRLNIKVSHVEASEITRKAKELIAVNPSFLEEAKAAIAKMAETKIEIDVSAIQTSPKKVAAAEAKKVKPKTDAAGQPISAKQASKPATRAKGSAPPPKAKSPEAHATTH